MIDVWLTFIDRLTVLREAAACHVQTGRWDTAYKYCQMIVQDSGSAEAAFNSLVCLVALKTETRRIEAAFVKLVSLKTDYQADGGLGERMDAGVSEEYRQMISHDLLNMWEKDKYAVKKKFDREKSKEYFYLLIFVIVYTGSKNGRRTFWMRHSWSLIWIRMSSRATTGGCSLFAFSSL